MIPPDGATLTRLKELLMSRRLAAVAAVLAITLAGCAGMQKTGRGTDPADQPDAEITGSIQSAAGRRGEQTTDWRGVVSWYAEFNAALPTGYGLSYCSGFGCMHRSVVRTDGDAGAELAAIMAAGAASPSAERDAIEAAVSWFERKAIPLMGGVIDTPGTDSKDFRVLGQTDCIDEAANTTTLLIHMQNKGLMTHHTVTRPIARGGLMVPHVTAVIRERQSGVLWAVDSWALSGGERPVILTVDRWDEWMGTGH